MSQITFRSPKIETTTLRADTIYVKTIIQPEKSSLTVPPPPYTDGFWVGLLLGGFFMWFIVFVYYNFTFTRKTAKKRKD